MKYADSIEGSVEEIKNLFSMPGPPTAIVAACDAYAIQTMYLLQSMGLKIPGDVSVTGFDDIPEAATFKPALTTIRKPGYEMGQESVRYLIELIDRGFSVQGPRFFDTELIVRESSSAPL
jgi:LacI family transcriptional regulator